MTTIPQYLQHARDASRAAAAERVTTARERSEKSEERRFEPGGRYRISGPVLGVIHPTDAAFDEWRQAIGLPRAGIMTIQGERVIVADVRTGLRTGEVDVVAVLKEESDEPTLHPGTLSQMPPPGV